MLPITPIPRRLRALVCSAVWLLGAAALLGCAGGPVPGADGAAWQAQLQQWRGVPLLLLGEQHDAAAHQAWERETVQQLAAQGQLAALVIEMADAGRGTAGLPADADASQVRQALHWNDTGWPWAHYGPVVLAAVRAGVPVLGGNLPRASQHAAMQDGALDAHLPPAALARQQQAVREGHCDLLPESQTAPMTRVQLARDASLARTAEQALRPGQTVLLIAGAGHVWRGLGIPSWLPAHSGYKVAVAQAGQAPDVKKGDVDYVHRTPAIAPKDYCAALRRK